MTYHAWVLVLLAAMSISAETYLGSNGIMPWCLLLPGSWAVALFFGMLLSLKPGEFR